MGAPTRAKFSPLVYIQECEEMEDVCRQNIGKTPKKKATLKLIRKLLIC